MAVKKVLSGAQKVRKREHVGIMFSVSHRDHAMIQAASLSQGMSLAGFCREAIIRHAAGHKKGKARSA